jgi:hypothetical protein
MMHLPVRIRIARSSTESAAPAGVTSERIGRPTLSVDERMFALGTRTLADLIAPAGVEVRRDHLQLDAQYVRALAVTGYPRTVAAGWLAPLVDELDLPLELSLHVRPLASGDMVRALGLQIAKLESSRRVDVLAQRITDPERDIGLEDAERLRNALQRGDERVFSVSLYILLRAPTRRMLDEATRRVETQLGVKARPGRSAMAAMQVLAMCPLLPADAFRHLAGFRSIGGAYRRLEKRRRAGLAEIERAELGYLLADRPVGLWSITERGQRLFDEVSCADRRAPDFRGPCTPVRGEPSLTSRVAAYRLLAFFVAECNADGRKVELCAWEHPWVRTVRVPEQGNSLRVQLPAGAVLADGEMGGECAGPAGVRMSVVLVPDLGAAPVTRHGETLRRLFAYREFSGHAEFSYWSQQSIGTETVGAPAR